MYISQLERRKEHALERSIIMYETLEFFEDLINDAINKADIPKHFNVTSEYFGWTITNDKTNEEVEIRIEEVY